MKIIKYTIKERKKKWIQIAYALLLCYRIRSLHSSSSEIWVISAKWSTSNLSARSHGDNKTTEFAAVNFALFVLIGFVSSRQPLSDLLIGFRHTPLLFISHTNGACDLFIAFALIISFDTQMINHNNCLTIDSFKQIYVVFARKHAIIISHFYLIT